MTNKRPYSSASNMMTELLWNPKNVSDIINDSQEFKHKFIDALSIFHKKGIKWIQDCVTKEGGIEKCADFLINTQKML